MILLSDNHKIIFHFMQKIGHILGKDTANVHFDVEARRNGSRRNKVTAEIGLLRRLDADSSGTRSVISYGKGNYMKNSRFNIIKLNRRRIHSQW